MKTAYLPHLSRETLGFLLFPTRILLKPDAIPMRPPRSANAIPSPIRRSRFPAAAPHLSASRSLAARPHLLFASCSPPAPRHSLLGLPPAICSTPASCSPVARPRSSARRLLGPAPSRKISGALQQRWRRSGTRRIEGFGAKSSSAFPSFPPPGFDSSAFRLPAALPSASGTPACGAVRRSCASRLALTPEPKASACGAVQRPCASRLCFPRHTSRSTRIETPPLYRKFQSPR